MQVSSNYRCGERAHWQINMQTVCRQTFFWASKSLNELMKLETAGTSQYQQVLQVVVPYFQS
eukprot:2530042-Pleurochrysis_carterae.AAC.1